MKRRLFQSLLLRKLFFEKNIVFNILVLLVSKHEKWSEWRKEVPEGLEICFSFAGATSPDRERAECALIYHHKPKCNDECKDSFPYQETTVVSTGRHEFIESSITVQKTVKKED